jgi:hypothetical protein
MEVAMNFSLLGFPSDMGHRLAICMLCLGGADAAFGDASVSLEIRNGNITDTVASGSGATSFAKNLDEGAQLTPVFAHGSADLVSGTLKADAVAWPTRTPRVGAYLSFVDSRITDTLTFGAGASGTAFLDYHLSGSVGPFTPSDEYSQVLLQFAVGLAGQAPAVGASHFVTNGDCAAVFSPTSCRDERSTDEFGTFGFAILPGVTTLQVDLKALAQDGSYVLFGDSASLYLRLPPGTAYTSGTGQFLAAATPIALSVPEPDVLSLMLGALLVGGVMTRRRNVPPIIAIPSPSRTIDSGSGTAATWSANRLFSMNEDVESTV